MDTLIANSFEEIGCLSAARTTLSPTHQEAIKGLIKIVDQVPQLEIPPKHYFLPGFYAREITMPAGTTGVGHIHKQHHLNVVLSGHAIVTWDGQTQEIIGPSTFESLPGAQKAFQVFEDFRLMTVHANPKNITDLVEIEREIFDLPQDLIDSGLTIDEFRMRKNLLH